MRKSISHIVKDDGSSTSSMEEVASILVDFYKNLFGIARQVDDIDGSMVRHGPVLGINDSAGLIAPVLDAEIRAAWFDIGNDKAPGPDGYTSGFFKARWSVVGNNVCGAVREFFATGSLL